jgi:hypothetical protein
MKRTHEFRRTQYNVRQWTTAVWAMWLCRKEFAVTSTTYRQAGTLRIENATLTKQRHEKDRTDTSVVEAAAIIAHDRDSEQRDLFYAIDRGDFPGGASMSRSCRRLMLKRRLTILSI